jgi:diguanylate cyclase (GGDEF)-like protein/PAS domain S-box-containing protein
MDDTDIIPPDVLSGMLMRMFEFAPIAMAITTSDASTSSYAKVNDAYLKLTGLKWEDISGRKLTSDGAAIDNPARDRRHRMLAEEGAYVLEEVDIKHADGTIIPTLISAQRTIVDGLALRASARTDGLSGLPNRACLDETLAARIDNAPPGAKLLALAFIDLNGFKAVNDRLGHAAGDEVIRTIASRFRDSFRTNDFIARVGGDEFVVLIEADPVMFHDVCETLNEAVERIFKPIAIDGAVTEVGAAVGVALLEAGDTVASFMKRADDYMYLAKQTGERVAVIWLGNPDRRADESMCAVG